MGEKDDETDEMYRGGVFILDLLLTAALIAGNVSCSQPSGGSEPEFNGGSGNDKPQYKPGECVGETIYQGEFGGAQFVGANEDWTYNYITPNTEFDKHYANAKNFMDGKVTELQQMVNGKTASLYKTIDTALKKCKADNSNSINTNITTNYEALAPVFYNFQDETILSDNEFQNYQVSYYKLAHNAYQKSLSDKKNSLDLPVTAQMNNNRNNFFNKELNKTNPRLTYNDLTFDKAKSIMNETLTSISTKTQTEFNVLKKVVELALYNESLYGLNDFATLNKVNVEDKHLNSTHHMINDIKTYISDFEMNNTRSIDDGRTM